MVLATMQNAIEAVDFSPASHASTRWIKRLNVFFFFLVRHPRPRDPARTRQCARGAPVKRLLAAPSVSDG